MARCSATIARSAPANLQAVQRLQNAGLQVVLASGRHHLNMQRFAALLPGVEWLVSCQGGEVSSTARDLVLNREFLPAAMARQAFATGTRIGFTTIAYCVESIFTTADWNEDLEFYAHLAGYAPRQIPVEEILSNPIFKVIWIGEKAAAVERAAPELNSIDETVQMVRTHRRLLEFMPAGVSKATALKIMAARLGLGPAEIIAFGDGENDVPMFSWAGASVAMPHGWPAAIQSATYIAPAGAADTAFARGVDMLFDKDILS